jgi:hypothetical protein
MDILPIILKPGENTFPISFPFQNSPTSDLKYNSLARIAKGILA